MSKDSLYWGKASGKLGETVLYTSGGQQRARKYVSKIANPKSPSQMVQRLKMANIVSAYQGLVAVTQVAFPNKSAVQSGWNRFAQLNASKNLAIIDKAMKDSNVCIPAGFTFSEGNINFDTTLQAFSISGKKLTKAGTADGKLSGLWLANVDFGTAIVTDAEGAAHTLKEDIELAGVDIIPVSSAKIGSTTRTGIDYLKAALAASGVPSKAKVTVLRAHYNDEAYKLAALTLATEAGQDAPVVGTAHMPMPTGWAGSVMKNFAFIVEGSRVFLAVIYQEDEKFASDQVMGCLIVSYTNAVSGKLEVTTSKMMVSLLQGQGEILNQYLPPMGEVYLQILEANSISPSTVLSTTRTMATTASAITVPAYGASAGEPSVPPEEPTDPIG